MRNIGGKRLRMLGKAQIKYIRSLQNKKIRHTHFVYVIEGEKIVAEYIHSDYPLNNIYAAEDWLDENAALLKKKNIPAAKVSQRELEQISSLATPNKVLALAKMQPTPAPAEMKSILSKGFHLALDNIQDPGNLGTIIRTADWFGAATVFCSNDCVDAYNPKVAQAAMGSLARVKIIYTDLPVILTNSPLPVYAATLNGENLFSEKLPGSAIVLIGNESSGLSEKLIQFAAKTISIPRFGKAESLNAAVAAAVIMAAFRNGQATSSTSNPTFFRSSQKRG